MADVLANVAELAITPPLGVHLLEPRGAAATGVYDDLFVRALAFSDGATRLAVVTLDLLGLDMALADRVQRAVSARTGVPADHLMIAASHTHRAPVTIAWDHAAQPQRDRGWEADMVERTAACVAQAFEAPTMLPIHNCEFFHQNKPVQES